LQLALPLRQIQSHFQRAIEFGEFRG